MSGDLFEDWDAAYVLGSLGATDRRAYEAHLSACPACSAAVAELAAMPGLLALVPDERAIAIDERGSTEHVGEVPDLVPRLARRRRLRRRRLTVLAGVTAAVVVVAAVAVVAIPRGGGDARHLQMHAVASTDFRADVTLSRESWGTRIETDCDYDPGAVLDPADVDREDLALYVTDVDGVSDRVATWRSSPGRTVDATATTNVPLDRIDRVDIRSIDTDDVLLGAVVAR